jgi:hypothetical protein
MVRDYGHERRMGNDLASAVSIFKVFFFFLRRYNFEEVLAFSTNSFHLERFLM